MMSIFRARPPTSRRTGVTKVLNCRTTSTTRRCLVCRMKSYRRHNTGGAYIACRTRSTRQKSRNKICVSTSGQGPPDLAVDKARALALVSVSRETEARLDVFVDVLMRWQSKLNLVAPSTLPELWTRHVADSLQLLALAPEARVWADFGSGGGFPGLPIACALAGVGGAKIHLIESNGKKAAFLRAAVKATAVPAIVHHMRVEKFGESCAETVQVVTARAVAPLKTLCVQAFPFIAAGAIGLFPKGQDVASELTDAAKYWRLQASRVPSRTSPDGSIVVIRALDPLRES